ncbi:hypothetical protein, partial [Shouchella clausii]|uniref:hypothetical protein n=1 Tax=Shouchella clausii TaxID=79880 RepID=UPI001C5297FE
TNNGNGKYAGVTAWVAPIAGARHACSACSLLRVVLASKWFNSDFSTQEMQKLFTHFYISCSS